MLESLLVLLAVAFVVVTVLAVVGVIVARWIFVGVADRVARTIDRSVGGPAARGLTRLAAYAAATGIDVTEADRGFGRYIDRFARLMDSAVRLPVIGPIGLDVVIGLFPVAGDLAAGGLSLLLVARSLRYGPPASLVSKMLANVLTDMILGAIPVVGVLADIWFKANDRNAALMREFLDSREAGAGPEAGEGAVPA